MSIIPASELILNSDGSIYHLNLLPHDIADTIITVGDPDRVSEVSRYFDSIEIKKQKREFITHTGYIGKQRLSVISTGISTDNIDIVFNELDALANLDLQKRTVKPHLKNLTIIRIGTSGGLQPSLPVGSFVVSESAVGLDGLGCYYTMPHVEETAALKDAFTAHFAAYPTVQHCYAAKGHSYFTALLGKDNVTGITVTCGGFYGPQGRILRGAPKIKDFLPKLQQFQHETQVIANFEMETAGIYALGQLLGHHCCSISAIIANRLSGEYCDNPVKVIDNLIQFTLDRITTSYKNIARQAKLA